MKSASYSETETGFSMRRNVSYRTVAGILVAMAILWGASFPAPAATITVPNASFESPVTTYADPRIDSWQKTPQPSWYVESTWDQLVGAFANPTPDNTNHIGNCDGNQAIWIFAVPEIGLFQDYDSTDWANPVPTHAFDAVFEVGKSYELTVGVIGGLGNMPPGVTLDIGLYYRDSVTNQLTVASTSITNLPGLFLSATNLVDFKVVIPPVKAGDAWAGRHIGIRFLSTASMPPPGGYWDLDNIRLASFTAPTWAGAAWNNGVFTASLHSEPGLRFEILSSEDAGLPISGWNSRGYLTNTAGSATFTDTAATPAQRFYRARQLP